VSKVQELASTPLPVKEILQDYELAIASREASLIGRKEVFMGKAKFGIFGDGKETPQMAMAKVFRSGDFRSGYYRDQTFMFAIDELSLQEYFAQLYAHTEIVAEPASAGRMMNGHFATRYIDENGNWLDQTKIKNSSADISPTAGQMPRLVGLGYASKIYREQKALHGKNKFSRKGNEIAFGTIGNASTSEGIFLESVNAIGVLQLPVIISVWDDDYGISVPQKYHTTKESISEALSGFQRTDGSNGFEIFVVNGWDYAALIETYRKAEELARKHHVPSIIHVKELTQPQGHSTSGSHERYKSKERLEWEKEHDCIKKMREWIIQNDWASAEELDELEASGKQKAKTARAEAWKAFNKDISDERNEIVPLLKELSSGNQQVSELIGELEKEVNATRLHTFKTVRRCVHMTSGKNSASREEVIRWLEERKSKNYERYNSHLISEGGEHSVFNISEVKPVYSDNAKEVDGREVLQACFDALLERDPRVFAIGEDVGKIGDVNQAFAGLQEKFGELRVTDTGIRETSIIGQGIGSAMRGLRPITEIQYLDYLLYTLQTLSDDLASLHYRTRGGQRAPLIIRTRGHRLEGVWHSGSPMGMILHSLRGIHVLVPRNMTKAAGFYNAMIKSDDPALIIECLNGYRLKEQLPENIAEIITPLGIPEVIRSGEDVTIVTYGSMCRVVDSAASQLAEQGISCEVIDVQSLLPFDIHHSIVESLKKTNRIVFADEDVPGGASAFMMQQVLEGQQGYQWLDSQPVTITAQAHRPAYSSDGDYFSKPNSEDVFESVYQLMHESQPTRFPKLY
jgi:pyruvate/2-oxoglutarate/acetoin dehydrogenase E1 component/TPP-dependent pyruvate/acetoin dehydrogenase alpha subunit